MDRVGARAKDSNEPLGSRLHSPSVIETGSRDGAGTWKKGGNGKKKPTASECSSKPMQAPSLRRTGRPCACDSVAILAQQCLKAHREARAVVQRRFRSGLRKALAREGKEVSQMDRRKPGWLGVEGLDRHRVEACRR